MQIKTFVPVVGSPEIYKNKPVVDRRDINTVEEGKVIGTITDVNLNGSRYELIIDLDDEIKFDDELKSMSITYK